MKKISKRNSPIKTNKTKVTVRFQKKDGKFVTFRATKTTRKRK